MRGTITGRDVLFHPLSIARSWGMGTYLSCLWAAITRKPTTFLGVLYPASLDAMRAPAGAGPRWRPTR